MNQQTYQNTEAVAYLFASAYQQSTFIQHITAGSFSTKLVSYKPDHIPHSRQNFASHLHILCDLFEPKDMPKVPKYKVTIATTIRFVINIRQTAR